MVTALDFHADNFLPPMDHLPLLQAALVSRMSYLSIGGPLDWLMDPNPLYTRTGSINGYYSPPKLTQKRDAICLANGLTCTEGDPTPGPDYSNPYLLGSSFDSGSYQSTMLPFFPWRLKLLCFISMKRNVLVYPIKRMKRLQI